MQRQIENWRLRCDDCGRFIAYEDIENGVAVHYLVTPESAYTSETFETLCKRCYRAPRVGHE